MAHLGEDAHAVTGLTPRVLAGTMFQPLYDPQRVIHDGAAWAPVDIHHRTDAAGVMLCHTAIAQPLLIRHLSHPPLCWALVAARTVVGENPG